MLLSIITFIGIFAALALYSHLTDEPVIEIFAVNQPVTKVQRGKKEKEASLMMFDNVQKYKSQLGYGRFFYRQPTDIDSICLGNGYFSNTVKYFSDIDFKVSGGRTIKSAVKKIGSISLENNGNPFWFYRQRFIYSKIFLWLDNEIFEDRIRLNGITECSAIHNADIQNRIVLGPKEYVFVATINDRDEIYFQSDGAFKLKLSNCPKHFYVINSENNENKIFKFVYDSENYRKRADCSFTKGARIPESIYIYDPSESYAMVNVWININNISLSYYKDL